MEKIKNLTTGKNSLINAIKKTYNNSDQPQSFSFNFKKIGLGEGNAILTIQYFSSIKQYNIMGLNLMNLKTKKTYNVPAEVMILLIKANSKTQNIFYSKVKESLEIIGFSA